MECSCGSHSMREARAERSKNRVVLEYQVCSACGRNEYGALRQHGEVIASGLDAQRMFQRMEAATNEQVGAAVETRPVPSPTSEIVEQTSPVASLEPAPGPDWMPVSNTPLGDDLIRVRYAAGGYYVGRVSYFNERWDLIDAWQPFDNSEALAASFEQRDIPPELRVSTLKISTPRRQAAPNGESIKPVRSGIESVEPGQTLSLF